MADGAIPAADRTVTATDNNPPADGWEGLKVHLDDLVLEARNWADGTPVETAEQDEAVSKLIDELREAAKLAEARRVEEKKPLDEQITAIQERYNEYIAPKQNKKPGKVTKAIEALLALVQPYRARIAAEKAAAAEAARLEAQRVADEAAAAIRASNPADLSERDEAEALVEAAAEAQKAAARATKAAATGTGLTTYYEAVLTDRRAAIIHYMNAQPDEFVSLVQRLADTDVRAGKRQIPGFTVEERKRAR